MFCAVLIGSKVVESSRRPMVSTPAASAMVAPTERLVITVTRPIRIHLLFNICIPLLVGFWWSVRDRMGMSGRHLRRSKQRLVRVDMRNSGDEGGRVGMLRTGEHFLRPTFLDDRAAMHHHDTLA